MRYKRLAENIGRKIYAKDRHLRTIAQFRRAISSQLRRRYSPTRYCEGDIAVKHQYLLHTSSQYGNFGPLTAESGSGVWTPSKFQRVSRLGFVTAPKSLNGGQPNFAQCLAVSWAGTLCIHFLEALAPVEEFCHIQSSLCVQILRSSILSGLLQGTRAAGVSQISAFSRGDAYIRYRAAITLGIDPHSSF